MPSIADDSMRRYKGGREFYRYVPRDYPPMQVFPLDGVTVDVRNTFLINLFVIYIFFLIFIAEKPV